MKDHVSLNELAGKISDGDLKECYSCTTIIEKNNIKFCTNKVCRANKKRLFTRKQNIGIRTQWREVEIKLNTDKDLYNSSIFPYMLLEVLIKNNYDEEIESLIISRLELKNKNIKKHGVKKIYELDSSKIKNIIEILVLRMSGLKRAEEVIKNI